MTTTVPCASPAQTAVNRPVIGVDIGGTKIAAGVVLGGVVLRRLSVPTPALEGAAAVVSAVADLVHRLTGAAGNAPPPVALGVGSAGVVDETTGEVLSATAHLAGWAGTALAADLADRTGLSTSCLNDVHAHALGECVAGAARGRGSALVVAAGTGLGGSFVFDGHPWFGAHHRAGHLGHVPVPEAEGLACSCGAVGHLEAVASGAGLLAAYQDAGGTMTTAAGMVRAAAAGDTLATYWLRRSGRALGRAVGGWANLLDPEVVVLTGGLARAGAIWWDAVTAGAQEESLAAVSVVPAALGADAPLVGAAAYAEERSR